MANQPVTYKSPEPVYVDGMYHNAGSPFVTTAEPNENWEKISGGEKSAIEAADKTLDVHPSMSDLTTSELRALAATKNVQTKADGKNLSDKELIAAIAAADEPSL